MQKVQQEGIAVISTCLHHAVEIEMRKQPKDWPAALEQVPVECREECREYLKGIAARIRVIRSMGCHDRRP